ncbi:hypothetical protein V8D89_010310 [Ganoderma adspersum]
MTTAPRPSPMDDQPPISNKSSPPRGQESTLLSFHISEGSHGRTASLRQIVAGPIHPLKAPPPPRAFIQSLPTTNVLAEMPVSADSSSSSLPPSLLPPPPPPPPPPPSASPPASMQQSSLLSRGAAGGIVVLVILAIIALAGGLVWYKRRRVRAVEVDPEEALFGACEDPRSPTFRLSTVGSVKGGSQFGATFRAYHSPYLPSTPRPPKSSSSRMFAAPSQLESDTTPPASVKATLEQ